MEMKEQKNTMAGKTLTAKGGCSAFGPKRNCNPASASPRKFVISRDTKRKISTPILVLNTKIAIKNCSKSPTDTVRQLTALRSFFEKNSF